jgi:Zn-dependent protease with chaperone function
MVYCALSLAVSLCWRSVLVWLQHDPLPRVADLLFAVRMAPVVTAAAITAAFTVPSFLLLEPRSIEEPVGVVPVLLALCGAVLALIGVVKAAMALRRASRSISLWTAAAQAVPSFAPIPISRIAPVIPAITAVGIFRPRVLLSGAAESMLTAGELQSAMNHEIAHVRRRDNLKKLFLRLVAFPGMKGLEAAWLEATEMAADAAAVSNAAEALDLAAALIKLSRLGAQEVHADLTAALVQSPASVMNARIERLIAWGDERRIPPRAISFWPGAAAGMATLFLFAMTYSQLLAYVHAATEWLVR